MNKTKLKLRTWFGIGFTAGLLLAPAAQVAAAQWLNGDTHVHDDHSSDGSLLRQTISQGSPGNLAVGGQILEGELMGLDFMPLTDHRTYDQHYDPQWTSNKLLLVPGEEANGSPHATVLGAVDSIVQGAVPAGQSSARIVQESLWDAHSQGASWGTAHPDDGEMNADGSVNDNASAVGIDTIEVWNRASSPDTEIDYAESRWNRGFRTGVAGGSDDHFKELWLASLDRPGRPTTSVLAQQTTVRGVVQGLWAGHTRVNGGELFAPVVTLDADVGDTGSYSALGGDEVFVPAGTPIRLRITVSNAVTTSVLLYQSPGRSAGAIQTWHPTAVLGSDVYYADVVAESAPTWYRVEVRGPALPPGIEISTLTSPTAAGLAQFLEQTVQPDQLRALTPPLYVSTAPVAAQPEIATPADGGSADGAQLALGNTGGFSGFPDVAVDGAVTHLVAEVHGTGTTQVMYSRRNADGSWTAPLNLVPASSQARFPRIVAQGGNVWVAWQDERAGEVPHRPAIYVRHSGDGGQTWAPELLVRGIAGRAEHPALALTAYGLPLVAWQEISPGYPFDVMAQVIGADAAPVNLSRSGKTFHPSDGIDTRSALYPASVWPAVAVAADGRIAIAWQDDRTDEDPLWTGGLGYGNGTDPDNWQIMVVNRAAYGSTWSAPASLGANDMADRHPSLVYTAAGRLVAAWDTKALQSSGANLSVLSAWSDDGGTTWTAPAAVAADPAAMSQWPRLGRGAGGEAQLAWYDSRSADWRWRIMTATLGESGWSAGNVLPSLGNNTWPALDGGVLVFASTRNAQRLQRDHTQQVFYLKTGE
jgi:hypothetical protein